MSDWKTKIKSIYLFARQVFDEFMADRCFVMSAALSYYTALSISPMLIVLVPLIGFVMKKADIRQYIESFAGKDVAELISRMMPEHTGTEGFGLATVITVATILMGATTVFSVLHDSFNRIWRVRLDYVNDYLEFLQQRFYAFVMLFLSGMVMTATFMANTVLEIMFRFFKDYTANLPAMLIQQSNKAVSWLIFWLLFTLMFKILSDAKLRWKDAWIGGFFTATLFTIGRLLIGFYLASSGLGLVYGAAGSLVVMLSWVYYSSAVVFLGAEFVKVYVQHQGSDIMPAKNAYKTDAYNNIIK
jgi:membrane protein